MNVPVTIPGSVAEVFDPVLAVDPAREALVTRSGRWSYAELDSLADRAASALRSFGVERGQRVAMSLPNDIDIVAAFHGTLRLGAVWVGINRILAPPEKRYLLGDSGASLMLCDEASANDLRSLPDLQVVVAEEGGEWHEAFAAAPAEKVSVRVDQSAPAAIAYTSGTTGRPKGAVHSQYNLLVPGAVLGFTRRYGPALRKGDFIALTVLNMQVLGTLLTAQAGGCAVAMDRSDAVGVADWIRREHINAWSSSPALLHSLAADDRVSPDDLETLDQVWAGGADCPDATRENFTRKFGKEVLSSYGLTEAPTVVAGDDPAGPHVPGASGRPLPHVSIHFVDDEICVGPVHDGPWAYVYHPMLGYWQQPAATAAALRDGLLHTGDVGFLDEAGRLYVRDRKDLLIIRGGGNVYPAEVERIVQELPAVASCAVVGIPDDRLGERVVAAVELVPGAAIDESELAAHCLANLARYKVPERWLVLESLPRNAMGKVKRAELVGKFGVPGK